MAVIVGTSTSSIGASEEAYRRLEPDGRYPADLRRPIIHTPHSLGDFVQHALGLTGISVTVATACSSSAKVFAQAERLIRLGLADAAVVGGVDTLCGSVLFGFNSLELVSPEPCRPFDVGASRHQSRRGRRLRASRARRGVGAWLLGYGESSDAHHMSTPHPEGLRRAHGAAGRRSIGARVAPADIDYINLHGTASLKNDEVGGESRRRCISGEHFRKFDQGLDGAHARRRRHRRSGDQPARARTRRAAGHAQYAAARCGVWSADPHRERASERRGARLSFSFGFGGSNCVLVFGGGDPP